MRILKLSIRSLIKDKARSVFYFLTFVLTTIFIFSFFVITFHPDMNITLGQSDNSMVTTVAVIVILIAMMCTFLSNDFYVKNKGNEISLLLMSGATVYQVGFFLFIQSAILMLTAIPIGVVAGYLLLPILHSIFQNAYETSIGTFYVTSEAFNASTIIIAFEVFWCTYLNTGYCYRNSIKKLQGSSLKIELYGLESKKLKTIVWVVLYSIPILYFSTTNDWSNYAFISFIGIIGGYGLLKYNIPNIINKVERNQGLQNSINFIALGFVRQNLKKMLLLIVMFIGTSILLFNLIIYHLHDPLISSIIIVSYVCVMVLLAITIIAKLGMEIKLRRENIIRIGYMGFTKKQIKKIINKEMLLFHLLILILPLIYMIVIIAKVLMLQEMRILLAEILLIIQILPIIISGIFCTIMYHKIVPK